MIRGEPQAALIDVRRRSLLLPFFVAVLAAALGLVLAHSRRSPGGSKASATVSGKTTSIKIANYGYQSATLTVRVGTKISVTNTDQTAHTLTARSGVFDSGTINPGKTAHITLTKPGLYPYYCQLHAFMSGTIKVIK